MAAPAARGGDSVLLEGRVVGIVEARPFGRYVVLFDVSTEAQRAAGKRAVRPPPPAADIPPLPAAPKKRKRGAEGAPRGGAGGAAGGCRGGESPPTPWKVHGELPSASPAFRYVLRVGAAGRAGDGAHAIEAVESFALDADAPPRTHGALVAWLQAHRAAVPEAASAAAAGRIASQRGAAAPRRRIAPDAPLAAERLARITRPDGIAAPAGGAPSLLDWPFEVLRNAARPFSYYAVYAVLGHAAAYALSDAACVAHWRAMFADVEAFCVAEGVSDAGADTALACVGALAGRRPAAYTPEARAARSAAIAVGRAAARATRTPARHLCLRLPGASPALADAAARALVERAFAVLPSAARAGAGGLVLVPRGAAYEPLVALAREVVRLATPDASGGAVLASIVLIAAPHAAGYMPAIEDEMDGALLNGEPVFSGALRVLSANPYAVAGLNDTQLALPPSVAACSLSAFSAAEGAAGEAADVLVVESAHLATAGALAGALARVRRLRALVLAGVAHSAPAAAAAADDATHPFADLCAVAAAAPAPAEGGRLLPTATLFGAFGGGGGPRAVKVVLRDVAAVRAEALRGPYVAAPGTERLLLCSGSAFSAGAFGGGDEEGGGAFGAKGAFGDARLPWPLQLHTVADRPPMVRAAAEGASGDGASLMPLVAVYLCATEFEERMLRAQHGRVLGDHRALIVWWRAIDERGIQPLPVAVIVWRRASAGGGGRAPPPQHAQPPLEHGLVNRALAIATDRVVLWTSAAAARAPTAAARRAPLRTDSPLADILAAQPGRPEIEDAT